MSVAGWLWLPNTIDVLPHAASDGTYLDDASNEAHHFGELAHVHVKMPQLIFDGLGCDNPASFANGAQTPEVTSWVQVWVWWFREIDLRNVGGEGCQRGVWRRGVVGAGRGTVQSARAESASGRLDT